MVVQQRALKGPVTGILRVSAFFNSSLLFQKTIQQHKGKHLFFCKGRLVGRASLVLLV